MNLTFIQSLIVFIWFITRNPRYDEYWRYLSMGIRPKYAFERVTKDGI